MASLNLAQNLDYTSTYISSITQFSSTTATLFPLTTVFTPASSCLTDYYQYTTLVGTATVNDLTFWEQGPPSTACYPPSRANFQFYSPGICPSSYAIACYATTGSGTNIETQATCCPSGFQCQDRRASTRTDDVLVSTDLCTKTDFAGTLTVTAVVSGTTSLGVVTDRPLNALGVSIRYRAADLASGGLIVPSVTGLKTAATSAASSSNTAEAKEHIPTGVKAGIAVGAVLGFTVAIGSVLCILAFRRRKISRNITEPEIRGVGNAQPGLGKPGGPEMAAVVVSPSPVIGQGEPSSRGHTEPGGGGAGGAGSAGGMAQWNRPEYAGGSEIPRGEVHELM
jgi:hypothetical protein